MCQALITEESPQPPTGNDTFANARVDISMTPQRHFCIVEMKHFEPLQPNNLVAISQHLQRRFLGGDIIASAPEMRRVNTYTQPLLLLRQQGQDSRELLKPSPQRVGFR